MKASYVSPRAQTAIVKLGNDIQIARRKRRIRQADFAKSIGVSLGTLQRLENGEPGVSIGTVAMAFLVLGNLEQLSDALDVARDDIGLLHDEDALPRRVRKSKSKTGSSSVPTKGFGGIDL